MLNNVATIIGILGGCLVILGGYTGLVYKLAMVQASVNATTEAVLDLRNTFIKQEEVNEATSERIGTIDLRLTKLETQHHEHHRTGDK